MFHISLKRNYQFVSAIQIYMVFFLDFIRFLYLGFQIITRVFLKVSCWYKLKTEHSGRGT